ncbi:MAG: hypothetical protein ACFFBU_07585 [Promethearchaeota archaeon]
MNKTLNKQNLVMYLNGVIILGCVGLLLIGCSSTLLAGIPDAHYELILRTELGQVIGKVTRTHPSHNVSFSNLGTALIEIEVFTTNETPVTLRIYSNNLSFPYPLVHESTNLTEHDHLRVDVQHDVTIEVQRETSNALFSYWVNMYRRIPMVANTLPVRWMNYLIPLLVIGIIILIISLILLRRGLIQLQALQIKLNNQPTKS